MILPVKSTLMIVISAYKLEQKPFDGTQSVKRQVKVRTADVLKVQKYSFANVNNKSELGGGTIRSLMPFVHTQRTYTRFGSTLEKFDSTAFNIESYST